MIELNNLSVFQKTYELYKRLYDKIKTFPKGDRYTLGEDLKSTTLELLKLIVIAGSAKKELKIKPLDEALIKCSILKVFVRLACDTHCLNQQQYLAIQEQLQEISRMLGGWRRSI